VAAVVQAHGDDVLGLEAQVGVDHRPGTTMIGETPPSSAVIGFFSSGLPSRRRRGGTGGGGVRRAPHDGAERRLRSGDVDVVDLRMLVR
jgi:hypothetical protein